MQHSNRAMGKTGIQRRWVCQHPQCLLLCSAGISMHQAMLCRSNYLPASKEFAPSYKPIFITMSSVQATLKCKDCRLATLPDVA